MLTVAEVASRLRVSDATVRRLIRAGTLDAIKSDSGAVRVTDEALDTYLGKLWRPVQPHGPKTAA